MLAARASRVYRTEPQLKTDQPWFANQVLALTVEPGLDPTAFLARLKGIERDMGRTESERYGPRVIDLDIALFGDATLAGPDLTLPHPRLRERAFVLVPLAEVAPSLPLPPDGTRVEDALARLSYRLEADLIWQNCPDGIQKAVTSAAGEC